MPSDENLPPENKKKPFNILRIILHVNAYILTFALGGFLGVEFSERYAAKQVTEKGCLAPESVQLALKEQELALQKISRLSHGAAYALQARRVFMNKGIILNPIEMDGDNGEGEISEHEFWFELQYKATGHPVVGQLDGKKVPLAWNIDFSSSKIFGNAKHLDQDVGSRLQLPTYLESIVDVAKAFDDEEKYRYTMSGSDEASPNERREDPPRKGKLPDGPIF